MSPYNTMHQVEPDTNSLGNLSQDHPLLSPEHTIHLKHNDFSGPPPTIPKPDNTTRIYHSNLNSISLHYPSTALSELFQTMLATDIDIISICKHNLDTNQPKLSEIIYSTTKKHFSFHKLTITTSPSLPFHFLNQEEFSHAHKATLQDDLQHTTKILLATGHTKYTEVKTTNSFTLSPPINLPSNT